MATLAKGTQVSSRQSRETGGCGCCCCWLLGLGMGRQICGVVGGGGWVGGGGVGRWPWVDFWGPSPRTL